MLARVRPFWLPALTFCLLLAFLASTPATDTSPNIDYPIEKFAHNLGHSINSVWVGISFILLIVPSLWLLIQKRVWDWWAVRALLGVALEFLAETLLGKGMLTSLHRPNSLRPGFPSGHATMAFLLAWLMWQRYPRLGPLWFFIAALISWSRVEVHAHYPYQVIGGALIGMVLAALICALPFKTKGTAIAQS